MNKNVSDQIKLALSHEIEKKMKTARALQALEAHADLLREARASRVSRRKLAQILSENGIEATVDTVTKFCTENLGEVTKRRLKRRSKRKRKSENRIVTQAPLEQGAEPAKAEIQGATHPTPNTSRATKPGFRIAKDDL